MKGENKDPNVEDAQVVTESKNPVDSSDEEEEKMDEDQIKLWSKIDEVLKDYHLNQF